MRGPTASEAESTLRQEISWTQFAAVIINIQLVMLATYAPIVTGKLPANRANWLIPFVAVLPAALGLFVTYALVRRFATRPVDVYEILDRLYPAPVAKAFQLALAFGFLHWFGIGLRQFTELFSTGIYLRTPAVIFALLFAVTAAVGARGGMEFIGRIAIPAAGAIVVGLLLVIAGVLPQAEFRFLAPAFGEGLRPVLRATWTPMAVFSESVWVGMIGIPLLGRVRDAPKAIGFGLGVNVLMVFLGAAALLSTLGPQLIGVVAFPSLSMARSISIGPLIERVEWILAVVWLGSMAVKLSFLLHASSRGFFRCVSFGPFSYWPVALAAVGLWWSRQFFENHTEMLNFFAPETHLLHSLPLTAVPFVLYLTALVPMGSRKGRAA